jgi:glyceraldehyde 3-phosphate dehydrogenase
VDLVAELETDASAADINAAFRAAETGSMSGVLGTTDELLVSVDFIGDPRSSIVDLSSTNVIDGRFAKVLSWYDNEWGYSRRVVDIVSYVGERLPAAVRG